MQRVLVADDDAGIRSILQELLEDEGYDVEEAVNGAAVLTALNQRNDQRPCQDAGPLRRQMILGAQ